MTIEDEILGSTKRIEALTNAIAVKVGAVVPPDPPAPTAPNTPTNLTASKGTQADRVSCKWDPSTGATGYTLLRGASPIVNTPSTSFEDMTAQQGQTYAYSVNASNAVGASAVSADVSGFVTPVIVQPPPTGVSAVLSWAASRNAAGVAAAGYTVYLGTTPGAWTRTIDAGSATYFAVPGLNEGTLYYFVVTARNAAGLESWASGLQELWIPIKARTFHVSKSGKDTNAGSESAPLLSIKRAHDVATTPGDTIIVHAGTYDETLIIRHGGSSDQRRITYQAAAGEVVNWTYTGTVTQYLGVVYAVGSGQTNYQNEGPKNFVCIDGFNVSAKQTSNQHAPFFYITRGGNNNGSNWRFKNITGKSCDMVIFSESVVGTRVWDCTFSGNAQSGLWMFGSGGDDNYEVRRVTSSSNNAGKQANADGITSQDCRFMLLEDCVTFGINPGTAPPANMLYQYDGNDCGSQNNAPNGPGMQYTIFRRCQAYNNSNTNFPASSQVKGPLVFQYCEMWGNYNWGSHVNYDYSTNTEVWHMTADDVGQAHYYTQANAGQTLTIRNSLYNLRNANNVVAKNDSSGKLDLDYCRKAMTGGWGVALGAHCSVGPIGFADANFQNSHDYRLAATSPARGTGAAFMASTNASGSNTATVPVTTDPRKYFWPGDQIQIGNQLAFVIALTANQITLSSPVSFAASAGVHLPYDGAFPDLGAKQYTARMERPTSVRVLSVTV